MELNGNAPRSTGGSLFINVKQCNDDTKSKFGYLGSKPKSFKLEEDYVETIPVHNHSMQGSLDLAWMRKVMAINIPINPCWLNGHGDDGAKPVIGRIAWYTAGTDSFLLSFDTMLSERYLISYEDLRVLIKSYYGELCMESHLFEPVHPPVILMLT